MRLRGALLAYFGFFHGFGLFWGFCGLGSLGFARGALRLGRSALADTGCLDGFCRGGLALDREGSRGHQGQVGAFKEEVHNLCLEDAVANHGQRALLLDFLLQHRRAGLAVSGFVVHQGVELVLGHVEVFGPGDGVEQDVQTRLLQGGMLQLHDQALVIEVVDAQKLGVGQLGLGQVALEVAGLQGGVVALQ